MTVTEAPQSRGIRYKFPIDHSLYHWPTFSDAEFERRHQIVRDFMDEHGLDCLLIHGNNSIWERAWANIRWVSNYMGTMELDCVCVFPRHGEPTLAVLGLNARLPDRLARSIIPDIRGALNTAGVVVDRLKELRLDSGRIGIIPPAPFIDIPHDHHVALTEAFPKAEFPRFSDEFWLKRMTMSSEELACFDEAGRIGDAAVQGIIDRLKVGMREQDLFNIIYDVFSREGGENPCMVLAASENMFHPTSAFQRPRPVERTIEQGDILMLELGARDGHGYEAQTGKPIIFGPPPDEYAAMLDTCLEAYHAIVAELKPGCNAAKLRAAGQVITDRGYTVVAPLVHGLFNPIDAGPFVGTSHRPDKDVVLQPGMGVCVEIHPCSADVVKGVFLGDTYIITEDGARSVNKLEAKVYQL
jgi:Xaa-Pro aminopeptidase